MHRNSTPPTVDERTYFLHRNKQMPAWQDPSSWLLRAVTQFQRNGGSARALHLSNSQLSALLQFGDTGPSTSSFADFIEKLHTASVPDHRPNTPISARRLRATLKTLRVYLRPSHAYRLLGQSLAPGDLKATPYSLNTDGSLSQYRCGYVGIPQSQVDGMVSAHRVVIPKTKTNVLALTPTTLLRARVLRNYPYIGRAMIDHNTGVLLSKSMKRPTRSAKPPQTAVVDLYRGSC